MESYEWSMGNGQCPCCYGNKPNKGWWTDTVGHKKECSLAGTMDKAGLKVIWEYENPDRSVGWYCPTGSGVIHDIRHNDPDKAKKLIMQDEQGLNFGKQLGEKLAKAIEVAVEYDDVCKKDKNT